MNKQQRPQQLRVGRLTKPHGLKGALKLELYTDAPERRFAPGVVYSLQVPETSPWNGKTLTLRELRWYNQAPVGFFEGVDDRSAAESLVKAILWVDIAQDEPAEPDAWYDHDLVGLAVMRDGVKVGEVTQVDHMPAQDLLVVKAGGREVLVPFVSAIVPQVDIEGGFLVVTPPAGLFEELPDDEADAEAEAAGDADAADTADTADTTDTADTADTLPATEPGAN